MSDIRILELIGGPLDGTIHEIAAGFPVPDRIGLPDGKTALLHWYATDAWNGNARFIMSSSKRRAKA